MDKYKRKDNETTIDYLLRLTEIKIEQKPDDLEWNDIVRYCGFDCHYDSLRKALQPSEYGGFAIYKYLKSKLENEVISSDDVLKEYELKKQELYKQQVKFYDQRRELNDILRKQSRRLFIQSY